MAASCRCSHTQGIFIPVSLLTTKNIRTMVTKSKLRLAIAAEKGVDFKKLKQQKKYKEALKRKSSTSQLSGAPLDGSNPDSDEDKDNDDDGPEAESEDDETQNVGCPASVVLVLGLVVD